jgi:hypothetical protein
MNRRDLLKNSAVGLTAMSMGGLNASTPSQLSHFPAKVKRVIFLFMHGGPSHVDTFDYKPILQKNHGKTYKYRGVRFNNQNRITKARLLASPFNFKQYGESGKWVSSLFPKQADIVDDLCFLQGVHTKGVAHGPATLFLHTGSTNLVRPSLGSWISYGLGTENKNLPAFVTLFPSLIKGGQRNYGNAFLPSSYQGVSLGHAGLSIDKVSIPFLSDNLRGESVQENHFKRLMKLNELQVENAFQKDRVEGAHRSFELARAMQKEKSVLDISSEPQYIKDLYGVGSPETRRYGTMCLLARKLSETGVRFVQVNYSDNHANPGFDQHKDLKEGHPKHARAVDQPVAALIKDLKQRGLLDETLVIWTGEFGRTPYSTENGRDHNPFGFTSWMAGGGLKKGFSFGATDDVGRHAVEGKVHVRDLHATVLHLLGLDHEMLTYKFAGRDFRLTDTSGKVVRQILRS